MSASPILPAGTLPSTSMSVKTNDFIAERIKLTSRVQLQKSSSLDSVHHCACPFEKFYDGNPVLVNRLSCIDTEKTSSRCKIKHGSEMISVPAGKSDKIPSVDTLFFEEGILVRNQFDDSVSLPYNANETTVPLNYACCSGLENDTVRISVAETSKEETALEQPLSNQYAGINSEKTYAAKDEEKGASNDNLESSSGIKSSGSQVKVELEHTKVKILDNGKILCIKGNFKEIIIQAKDEGIPRRPVADASTNTEVDNKTEHQIICGSKSPVSIIGHNVYVNIEKRKATKIKSHSFKCEAIKDKACGSKINYEGKKHNNEIIVEQLKEKRDQVVNVSCDVERNEIPSILSSSSAGQYSTANEVELIDTEENSRVIDETLILWCEDSERNSDDHLFDVYDDVVVTSELKVVEIQQENDAVQCDGGCKKQIEDTVVCYDNDDDDDDDDDPSVNQLRTDSCTTTLEVQDAVTERVHCLFDTDFDDITSSKEDEMVYQQTSDATQYVQVHRSGERVNECFEVANNQACTGHVYLNEESSKVEQGSADCLCIDVGKVYCRPEREDRDGSHDTKSAADVATINRLQDIPPGSDLVSKEKDVESITISVKLENIGEGNMVVDDCGLVDVYELTQKINQETKKLNRLFSKYKSRAMKIERLQNYLDQLKREKDEMTRLLHGVDKETVALRHEAAELRCTVTAVCDVSVAHIGKETDARRLEPACFRRYTNIRTAADASNALASVRNRIKALNELEVLIYRKELMLTHVLPCIQQDKLPVVKVHKVSKSKKNEQTANTLACRTNVVIEVVSEPNNWTELISHTDSPVTVSAVLRTSNDGTASEGLFSG